MTIRSIHQTTMILDTKTAFTTRGCNDINDTSYGRAKTRSRWWRGIISSKSNQNRNNASGRESRECLQYHCHGAVLRFCCTWCCCLRRRGWMFGGKWECSLFVFGATAMDRLVPLKNREQTVVITVLTIPTILKTVDHSFDSFKKGGQKCNFQTAVSL